MKKSPAEKNLVFETKYWKILLADNQNYLGRCFIILKRECGDLAKVKKEELLEFLEVVKKMERALRKAFNASLFNWGCLMNHAFQEKKPKPQVHWHLVPRYRKKVNFEGIVFEDLEFGFHYNHSKRMQVTEKVQNALIERIKSFL